MLRLSLDIPILRYGKDNAAVMNLNQAVTDSTLELMEANRGLWHDFFRWMLFNTMNTLSEYDMSGLLFTAYVDNKFVLAGGGSEGVKKIRVTGGMDNYAEVRSALDNWFIFEEVGLVIKTDDDDSARLSLDALCLQLSGAKIPIVKPESVPDDDPIAERIANFIVNNGKH